MGHVKIQSARRARGRGRGGGGGRGQRSGAWRDDRNSQEVERKNTKFEEYYNNLGIVSDDEQGAFWTAMRSDLPNSFRFTGSRGHALTVQRRLIEHHIPEITAVTYEGEKVAPPQPVEWYPSKLAWSMATPKNVIRRFPPFAAFQKFLVSENGVGNITRQEIVSMLPPLFMDVKPGMTVLDLCAAPGSKSAQLIEMVHGGEEARVRKVLENIAKQEGKELGPKGMEVEAELDLAENEADYEDDGRSTGLLIANDKEYRRAQMLVHQTKRLNSPNVVITNHDATTFPSLRIPSPGPGHKYLKFDRILADVPCSGDGTTRKNFDVWRTWTPSNALGLHPTQVRILIRALQMLKVGGRVVYSTCSLNPIENESVVAEAIQLCGGLDNVELVNPSGILPDLQRREGMRSWTVTDRSGRVWTSWDDVQEAKAEGSDENLERVIEGFFPPNPEAEIPLQRCMRVYPHLQDTGGFFVAVLEKKTELKVKQEPAKTDALPSMPTAEDAPISAAVAEIKSQTPAEVKQMTAVNAVDGIQDAEANLNGQEDSTVGQKRELETEGSDEPTSKRAKTDSLAEGGVENGTQNQPSSRPLPPSIPENPHTATANGIAQPSSVQMASDFAPGKKKQSNQPQEEAFVYLDAKHPELLSVYDFYSLHPRFPRDRFMVRNASGTPAKAIYYTSATARDVLVANEGRGIKFVHAGIKMFVKQDVHDDPRACKWRIQTEGLPLVESWVGAARAVSLADPAVLRRLLIEMFPRIADDAMLGGLAAQVAAMPLGCCVLRVEPGGGAGGAERLVLPLWRGRSSVNLMLPKEERRAMLLRLFDDETPLVDTHKERQAREAERAPELDSASDDEAGVAADAAAEAAEDAHARPRELQSEMGTFRLQTYEGAMEQARERDRLRRLNKIV